jgi:hypothetical protein
MSHCKACDGPLRPSNIPDAFDADGNPVEEFCCDRCRAAAFTNMPEGYYDGLWSDKNCHPNHVVLVPEEDYLI